MFYITFHKTESNIWAYDDSGNLLTTTLLATSGAPTLAELRGMTFGPNGYLYIANGYKNASQVLVYEASNGDTPYPYDFIGIYADPTVSAGIAHPFAVAFDSSNNGYVSSQDTNVVTLLPPYPLATPPSLAVASYLQTTYPNPPNNPFLPGTFVASCYGALNGVSPSPPNVPQPQGLDIDPPAGPAQNSVRDVLINNGLLYVADEPGNAVNIYYLTDQPPKTQGQLQGQITNTNLQSPTHLLANDGSLYIACSDCILACVLGGTAVATFLTGLTSASGMAFDSSSNFFFADRKDQCIYQSAYDSEKKQYNPPAVFIPAYDKKHAPDGLKDEPEFPAVCRVRINRSVSRKKHCLKCEE